MWIHISFFNDTIHFLSTSVYGNVLRTMGWRVLRAGFLVVKDAEQSDKVYATDYTFIIEFMIEIISSI